MTNVSSLSIRSLRPGVAGLAAVMFTLLGAGPAAASDTWPKFRPGMWEVVRKVENFPGTSRPDIQVTKSCTEPGGDIQARQEKLGTSGCKLGRLLHTGNTYTYSSTCDTPGAAGKSKSLLTFENMSAYQLWTESDLGGKQTREHLTGKRIGDC